MGSNTRCDAAFWVGMHSVLFHPLETVACGQKRKKEHKSAFWAWAPWCTYWALWNTSSLILEDPGSGRTYRQLRGQLLTSWTICLHCILSPRGSHHSGVQTLALSERGAQLLGQFPQQIHQSKDQPRSS